jgi:hypothetical protein
MAVKSGLTFKDIFGIWWGLQLKEKLIMILKKFNRSF